jgi:competence protein ComFC
MGFLNTILDIIFPVRCLSCGKSGQEVCQGCLAICEEAERPTESWVHASYDYRNPTIKKSITMLKYKGKKRLANIFADVMHGRIMEELSELQILENFRQPILVPIPLSGRRLRERGFNQAELLCNQILKLNSETNLRHGVDIKLEKNILIKPKDTEHQARIRDRSKRLKNLAGTFAVSKPDLVKGRNIILIDDVTTTGATLGEAKKVLKHAGARKVIAFTIAH